MVSVDRKLLKQVGAWALIVGPIQFVIAMAVEGAIKPDFSQVGNVISDLGVGPYAIVFNVSVALVGVCTLLGLLAVFAVFPRRRSFWPATFFLGVAGVGSLAVGVFPENTGAPHGIAAAMAFLGAGFALIFYFFSFRKDPVWREFALYTLLGGLIDLGAVVAFMSGHPAFLHAVMERVIVAPVLIWAPAVGIHILRTSATQD